MGLFGLGKKKAAGVGVQLSHKSVSAIEAIEECSSPKISTQKRKEICTNVITNYSESQSQLDRLAVAIAHKYLGAAHRKQAIQYYELYLLNPVRIPNKTELQWVIERWMIRSDMAKLYESECEFDKAIAMLEECITLDDRKVRMQGYGFNPANYTRIATIIMKRDGTAAAIEYYKKLKKSKVYKLDKEWFDEKYEETLEKHKSGYVYKAKKK